MNAKEAKSNVIRLHNTIVGLLDLARELDKAPEDNIDEVLLESEDSISWSQIHVDEVKLMLDDLMDYIEAIRNKREEDKKSL